MRKREISMRDWECVILPIEQYNFIFAQVLIMLFVRVVYKDGHDHLKP